ncbi:MAG TPA: ferritin-like domain-containing protein [Steroidobacteraceae bacterium]|nr:ferritin-like domain-containing protein [Steroidobacteraceae bacterium]
MNAELSAPSREKLLHTLYEAAELEHNLMCTYLYAAFSLKAGAGEGLSAEESAAVAGWRRVILDVAIDEMGHLAAVWNITAALGGSPRFGRGNFPLDPGALPASVVVKLAPFNEAVLQHFIHLERPLGSSEPDGEGYAPEFLFKRQAAKPRLTPMGLDYETVGAFYETMGQKLREFVERHGEDAAFCGDPALQLSTAETSLMGAKPVICLKTALAAFTSIILQGEGAPADAEGSHFQRFIAIRKQLAALKQRNPAFEPAFPAAVNPVQRTPMRATGRVWIENETAAATVDVANTGYALMLRLIAYSYLVPRPSPEKGLAVDLALGVMRAVTFLGERAARLPAGPSNPSCNAGMSFVALRDAAPLPPGPGARRFFVERLEELSAGARMLDTTDSRSADAARILAGLVKRAIRGFDAVQSEPAPVANAAPAPANTSAPPVPTVVDGVEEIEGRDLTLLYEGRKCIHSRNCVTWGPNVFLANVQGPWIKPDAMEAERLAEIAHVCPSGAIRYRRKDGKPEEAAPLVNLIAVREGGPYAVRADIRLDGKPAHFRATLCRCGASKNKPYCDGSHHDVKFDASGEPATQEKPEVLAVRNGPLAIDPQLDGPLRVSGNLEITSGTGRMVTRVQQTRLCRCGGSANKPFCDGTHAKIGFRS